MQTQTLLARSAGPAIAAVLVLGSTPALAQDAGQAAAPMASPALEDPATVPPLILPIGPAPQENALSPSAEPQPVIVLPSPSSSPAETISQPVVQQVPVETAEDTSPPPAEDAAPVAPSTAEARNVPAAPATTAQPSAEQAIDTQEAAEQLVAPPPVPLAIPEAQPVPVSSETSIADDTFDAAGIVGLLASVLAALGLGVIGVVLFRRRRTAPVPKVERPKVAAAPADKAKAPVAPAVAPAMTDIREWAQPEPALRAPAVSQLREGDGEGGLPHAGAAIALPRTPPKSAEARQDLLRRMVAAKPDRANPFRSRKARRRRARLILQSLGHAFPTGKSRIDLSQYPRNWPELVSSKPMAA